MDVEEVSKVKGEGSIRWEGRNLFLVNDNARNRLRGAPHQEEGLPTRGETEDKEVSSQSQGQVRLSWGNRTHKEWPSPSPGP